MAWVNGDVSTSARISTMIGVLCNNTKTQYPVGDHSSDTIDALGEDIPKFVEICREIGDWKTAPPSINTQ